MTAGIKYIILPVMVHVSKYVWLMFYFLIVIVFMQVRRIAKSDY